MVSKSHVERLEAPRHNVDRLAYTEKVWGQTALVVCRHGFEQHALRINKGGYCSRHRHVKKVNLFYVQQGQLTVEIFDNINGVPFVEKHVLGPDCRLEVPPGVYHRFLANSFVIAHETYWTCDGSAINQHDIERLDQGGVATEVGGDNFKSHVTSY